MTVTHEPEVECETCGGTGEYFWHADDCCNDSCALAGGIDDCDGQVVQCHCNPPDESHKRMNTPWGLP